MGITINGSSAAGNIDLGTNGTITDLAVGGLPDGTIDTDSLANNAVTDAKSAIAEYDDTKLRRDLNILALHTAVDNNKAAHNLSDTFIDQFENDTGIGTETNVDRNATGEYVDSSIAAAEPTGSFTNVVANNWDVGTGLANTFGDGTATHAASPTTAAVAVTAGSHANALTFAANQPFEITATNSNQAYGSWFAIFKVSLLNGGGITGSPDDDNYDWDIDHFKQNGGARVTGAWLMMMGSHQNYGDVYMGPNSGTSAATALINNSNNNNQTAKFAGAQFTVKRDLDGIFYLYAGDTSGTLLINSNTTNSAGLKNNDEVALAFSGAANGTACSFSNFKYKLGTAPGANATGTVIGIANTASSSRTKVSGVMLYKNHAGTATIGTDLKIYFTCNGGTNWTEAASYTASSDFSTGVKTIHLGETTCTAGTDVRYKAVWANQSATKVTQLHGIGVNY